MKPERRTTMVIGGCAYRMQVRAELASQLAAIGTHAGVDIGIGSNAPSPVAYDFQHHSNLPAGRCIWIRDQVKRQNIDLAVSVDADCWPVDPVGFLAELTRWITPEVSPDVAMITAPVFQDNGLLNWRTWSGEFDEERVAIVDEIVQRKRLVTARAAELRGILGGEREIEATGFGLVVLPLAWWRKHWPEPTPHINHLNTGEDIELSRGVRDRGGRIMPLNVEVKHAAFQL